LSNQNNLGKMVSTFQKIHLAISFLISVGLYTSNKYFLMTIGIKGSSHHYHVIF
jgi:glutaminase